MENEIWELVYLEEFFFAVLLVLDWKLVVDLESFFSLPE